MNEPGWAPTISIDETAASLDSSIEPQAGGIDRLGRFTVLRVLGRGGMGTVYVGYDRQLARKVALKLLRREATSVHARRRLLREAQALARLSHPNVVQVHEVGEAGDAMFIAMELIEGETLSAWSRGPGAELDWRARLDVLLQAGRGLAAAHAVRLIHRDFKPQNVLVGQDGRARVLDFGLVRHAGGVEESFDGESLEETVEEDPSGDAMTTGAGDSVLALSLTERGMIMGTPAYMAPEQHMGQGCDAAADQYGFCVTALELLHDRPPFASAPMRALAAAKLRRELQIVAGQGLAPRAVDEALLRGLAPKPEDRWPSLDALLDALEQLVRPETSRRWLGPAFVGLSLATGALAVALSSGEAVDPCTADPEAFVGVWDDERRAALRFSYTTSGLALAARAGEQAEARIDAWTAAWRIEQQASCRATRVHGRQSETMFDRRAACFERQIGEARAVIERLATADDQVIARTTGVLAQLPELGACSVAAIEAGPTLELSPETRARVDAEFEALSRARIELEVGRPEQAKQLAEAARAEGRSLDHAPLELAAELVLAQIRIFAGELEPGIEQLRATILAGERAELWDFVATARVELARAAAGDFAEPRLERWMIDDAQLALDRVGRHLDPREVRLEVARARVAEQAGDFAAALAAHERAWQLSEDRWAPDSRFSLRIGIGTTLLRSGAYDQARAELESSLVQAIETLGGSAPEVSRIRFNLGTIAAEQGELEAARAQFEAAIQIDAELWGDDSIELARDRFALAYLDLGVGEIERGCATIEEVEAIYERELGPRHDETAQAIAANAVCRSYAGDHEGALLGYTRALELQRELLGELHPDVGLQHYNIGDSALALGHLELARSAFARSRLVFEASLPADHPELALPIGGLARVRVETGEFAAAVPELERALALAGDSQPPLELAELQFGLARALIEARIPDARARAVELANSALASFEAAGIEARSVRVRAWLDALR